MSEFLVLNEGRLGLDEGRLAGTRALGVLFLLDSVEGQTLGTCLDSLVGVEWFIIGWIVVDVPGV